MPMRMTRRRALLALAATAALCLLAYSQAMRLPLIADDYLQIQLGRDYGPTSGWAQLASDALYRCRATSLVLTYWTERLFGLSPLAFNASSLLLHVLNSWLVLALGYWRFVGWRVSTVAACFFAVYQGHQEAVIWYAALPELLVFFFALSSVWFWIAWLQRDTGRVVCYGAALACYVLALLSKESAVAVVPLLALIVLVERTHWKARLALLAPFAALAVADFAMIYAARTNHLFFHDGTFSLHGPFWVVLPVSAGRLLWVWGCASLAVLVFRRARQWMPLIAVAGVWIVITLLPYSFLTYMPRVPSRHTYFASAGLALIVAAGFLTLRECSRRRVWVAGLLAGIVVSHQCIYLWTRKQRQFQERAAPTEALLRLARQHRGPLYVGCFPYDRSIAEATVEVYYGDRVQVVLGPRPPGTGAVRVWDLCGGSQPSAQ
jgi:hypothetical protein